MLIDILCLGNPNISGDSVGPRVGSSLEYYLKDTIAHDVKIIGTFEKPVIRSTFDERIKELRPGATCVVIDSALGNDVGVIKTSSSGLAPGEALLPWKGDRIGDHSLVVITASAIHELPNVPEQRIQLHVFEVYRILLDMIEKMQK